MELYVRKGVVPPPPPMGSGKIQVGAQTTPSPGGAGAPARQFGPRRSAGFSSHRRGSQLNDDLSFYGGVQFGCLPAACALLYSVRAGAICLMIAPSRAPSVGWLDKNSGG